MFSANPSISSIGLKSLDVAKGRGNEIRLGGERGWTEEERGRTRREWGQTGVSPQIGYLY